MVPRLRGPDLRSQRWVLPVQGSEGTHNYQSEYPTPIVGVRCQGILKKL